MGHDGTEDGLDGSVLLRHAETALRVEAEELTPRRISLFFLCELELELELLLLLLLLLLFFVCIVQGNDCWCMLVHWYHQFLSIFGTLDMGSLVSKWIGGHCY